MSTDSVHFAGEASDRWGWIRSSLTTSTKSGEASHIAAPSCKETFLQESSCPDSEQSHKESRSSLIRALCGGAP
jgi:hypothetical protein